MEGYFTADLADWPDHSHIHTLHCRQLFTVDKCHSTERTNHMFSATQYRAKAAGFTALLTNTLLSPNEISEFRNLEQTYTSLAENEEWMTINIDKRIQRREDREESPL